MEIVGDKKTVVCKNDYEIWILIIRLYGLLNNIQVSISEEKILAYFCLWGITKKTEDKILKDYVVSNRQILSNLKTSLLKKNFYSSYQTSIYKIQPYMAFIMYK